MTIARNLARIAVAGVAVGATVALTSGGADAAGVGITYAASGTSHIAKTNSTITIAPTSLSVSVDLATLSFTGDLPLLPSSTQFKVLGLLPVQAKVNFTEAAPLTGTLSAGTSGLAVTSTATYYIRLSNVKVAGIPTPVGNHCQTKNPVTVEADTPAGSSFDLTGGGPLAGTYTIGNFAGCGLTTGLINLLVPGSGNTINLTVSSGQVG